MWPISTRVNKPENDDPSLVDWAPSELSTTSTTDRTMFDPVSSASGNQIGGVGHDQASGANSWRPTNRYPRRPMWAVNWVRCQFLSYSPLSGGIDSPSG
jgi:hypothetical protein